jgi:hypothetical protein
VSPCGVHNVNTPRPAQPPPNRDKCRVSLATEPVRKLHRLPAPLPSGSTDALAPPSVMSYIADVRRVDEQMRHTRNRPNVAT